MSIGIALNKNRNLGKIKDFIRCYLSVQDKPNSSAFIWEKVEFKIYISLNIVVIMEFKYLGMLKNF